ncbi:fatty-acyl-CoA synthase/O-succinylbenzoic acid--CoA ligase [Stella humosa]|uniref:Long-chain-fatty-acid--CoA ligase n=1 Tax=Stella humosa TaxID=94 RepID=A0A3N1MKS4_9PROT|nr:class I adenylate-forming enzyme family protein [Stella humosa]ROQ01596.1 fatty-acyl-CoA synthase/O-succinylbenzoic acid--CoA ligase [Stella humosa]BBK31977.1 long-chain-fatty-acid--CoA ligase [Stella humosa]
MTATQAWFGAAIGRHAALHPLAPAIIGNDGTLAFQDAHRAIEGIAAMLLRHGVRPGRPLALMLGGRADDLLLLFACHRLGVPVLVLSVQDPVPLANALIARAAADLVVSGGSPVAPGLSVPSIAVGPDWMTADPGALPPPPDATAPCYLGRSSGTTGGVPKLVMSTHALEMADLDIGWSRFPLHAEDRYLAVIGFQFGVGRSGAQRALLRGGAVVLAQPFRAMADLVATARRHGATWTKLTPTHLRHILAAAPPDGQLLPGMRILAGTGPLAPAERRAILRRVSSELYIDYATNEVGSLAMATPEDVRRNPAGVGRPVAGMEMQVVDEHDRPCPPATIGTLRFRGPLFPHDYQHIVPGASSRFVDGWFYPGDAGIIDGDGQLVLKGRVDDLIVMGGTKIYPADVEDCLAGHPAVAGVAVVGIPDRTRGVAATAAVVLRSPVRMRDLLAHCHATLGVAASPVRLVKLDAMPLNEMGKIDRVALRRLLVDAGRASKGPGHG